MIRGKGKKGRGKGNLNTPNSKVKMKKPHNTYFLIDNDLERRNTNGELEN